MTTQTLYISICMLMNTVQSHIVFVLWNLKWAWSFLLHLCFFQNQPHEISQRHQSSQMRFDRGSMEQVECVICLNIVGEDDEIRELRCGHVFHNVCLERWLGFRNRTCPLCRESIGLCRIVSEHGHELLLFDFCSTGDSADEGSWWIR